MVTKKTAKKVARKKKITKKKIVRLNINESFSEVNQENNLKQNFTSIGKSGTFVSGGRHQGDHITTLDGVLGQIEYEKMMRSDTQVRKIYHSMANPIRSAKWDITPASDDPKDLEVAALIKQILFKDIPGGWKKKLDEILSYPMKGFALFEIVHRNYDIKPFGPYTGLANMGFRDQRTLEEWEYDRDTEALKRVKQRQTGDLSVDDWMPADTLIIFYNEQKGKDLGYPLARMLYGPYKRKLLVKQLQIIGVERTALPVPHVELPDGVRLDSAEAIAAQEQLEAFTGGEQAYFMTPFGWKLTYNTANIFDPSKTQVVVKSENEEMAGAIVAMFLEMGLGGNSGNQAGTESSIDFFYKGLVYLADNIADTINTCLIPSLVRMNYGDTIEVMPELTHSGITEEAGKELMDIVTGYTNAGVIQNDEGLEDHIRKVHNLPKKAEGEKLENQKTKPGTPDPDPDETENEVIELANKRKAKNARTLINSQSERVSAILRENLIFTANKYIADTLKFYKQLPENKKQNATSKVVPGGSAKLKKALRAVFTDISNLALDMARTEVPVKGDIKLSMHNDKFLMRLTQKYGDYSEIKLNDFSQLPAHIQVLIGKQADLITKSTVEELENRIAFQFSSSELNTNDPDLLKQDMENTATKYVNDATKVKATNVTSTLINESRETFFFNDEVLEEIHSFTFTNPSPVSPICVELTGTTFETNDVDSLRFSPPLHHNCKSYLRANLKSSKGVNRLDVTSLSPSAKAKKSITL